MFFLSLFIHSFKLHDNSLDLCDFNWASPLTCYYWLIIFFIVLFIVLSKMDLAKKNLFIDGLIVLGIVFLLAYSLTAMATYAWGLEYANDLRQIFEQDVKNMSGTRPEALQIKIVESKLKTIVGSFGYWALMRLVVLSFFVIAVFYMRISLLSYLEKVKKCKNEK